MRSPTLVLLPFFLAVLLASFAAANTDEIEELRESYEYYQVRGYYAIAESLATRRLDLVSSRYEPPNPEIARALLDLGSACLNLEDYARADSLLQASLDMCKALYSDAHIEIAEVLEALATLNHWRSKPDEAERYAREALAMRIAVLGENDVGVAPAYLCLGVALSGKSTDESEKFLRAALERFEAAGDSLGVADILLEMGALGERLQLEKTTQRALRIYRDVLGEENARVAEGLNALARVHHHGDPVLAEELLREALAMRLKTYGEGHRFVRQSRNNIAAVLGLMERYEEAAAVFREIIRSSEERLGPESEQNAPWYHNLGWALWKQGKFDEAITAIDHAIELRRATRGEEDFFISFSLWYKAEIAFELQRYDEAEEIFADLLVRWEREYGPINFRSGRALETLGLIEWARGNFREAESYLEQATSLFEQIRLMATRGFGSLGNLKAPNEMLAAARLELGEGDAAWLAVERIRGLTLSELLVAAEARQLTEGEHAKEADLARAVSNAEAALVSTKRAARDEPTPANESAVTAARLDLSEAQTQWQNFQAEIAMHYPVTEGLNYTLEDVQSGLSAQTAIVGWLDAHPSKTRTVSWVYVIRENGPVRWERLSDVDNSMTHGKDPGRVMFDIMTEHGRSAFIGREEQRVLEAKAQELWRLRFAPIEKHLGGVEEIVVVPSRGMSGLPIECFMNAEGAWVGERFSVSYAPSATLVAWLRSRELPVKERAHTALLIGDPPYNQEHAVAMEQNALSVAAASNSGRLDERTLRGALDGNAEAIAELPRLAGSRREVEGAALFFRDARLLLGVDASEGAIVELADHHELADFDVVHLATHALIDNSGPERSMLVLSQVQPEGAVPSRPGIDGRVTAAEIARAWDLNAELVTLSACQTALGKASAEGTMGLVSAFLQAGARCLLVSLWDVDDEATAVLMQRFYETWVGSIEAGTPVTKAEALRQSKVSLRSGAGPDSPFNHPYFWSAFILVGDAR